MGDKDSGDVNVIPPLHVIVVGGTFTGIATALRCYQLGCFVDIIEASADLSSATIAQHLLQEIEEGTDAHLDQTPQAIAEANDLLKAVGSDLRLKAGGKPYEQVLAVTNVLLEYLRSVPNSDLRILTNMRGVQLLRNPSRGEVVGLQVEMLSGPTRTATKFRKFADAVVVCCKEPTLLTPLLEEGHSFDYAAYRVRPKSKGAQGGEHGESFVKGIYVVPAFSCTVDAAAACWRAGAVVAQATRQHAVARGKSQIARCEDFTDEKGVFHKRTLDPLEWIPLPLDLKVKVTRSSYMFRFTLPSPTHQVGLFGGQHILVRKVLASGHAVIRPYSPVSRNSTYGHVDFVIKCDDRATLPDRAMQKHLLALSPGQTLDFKGPVGSFVYHRNMYREVGMIAGGAGITPMYQIIQSIGNHTEDNTRVRLLYGAPNESDVLCKEELMYYSATRENIQVHLVLENPPANWAGQRGFITSHTLVQHLPAPADDIIILMCGPPKMMSIMRDQLHKLGYTNEMIHDFDDMFEFKRRPVKTKKSRL